MVPSANGCAAPETPVAGAPGAGVEAGCCGAVAAEGTEIGAGCAGVVSGVSAFPVGAVGGDVAGCCTAGAGAGEEFGTGAGAGGGVAAGLGAGVVVVGNALHSSAWACAWPSHRTLTSKVRRRM